MTGLTSSKRVLLVLLGVAVLVVAVVALVLANDDDDAAPGGSPAESSATATDVPVVADDTWCAGWRNLVVQQGQYVAGGDPAALLAAVDSLQALGVPESLDPSGYTELRAVLDDVRASVDPSFTPSVLPSEPADVGDEHGHGDDAGEAPFGVWLAEYCPG